MATTEQITILKVRTEGAETVQDLKDNVSELKKVVADAKIGSEDYTEALNLLKLNQNALKDANYATSASLDQVKESAAGAGTSYNALVHRMAALKEEFRSTNDAVRRLELGQQINKVNQELKDLDAKMGNYQRNVGDYTNSVKKALGDFPSYADPAKKAIKGVNDQMSLMSGNPLFGIIALLTPVVLKIVDALKQNENAVASLDKAMTALQPVFDLFTKVIDTLAGYLAKAVDYFAELAGKSTGTFKNIVAGAVGVGNVLLQFILTPIRTIIDAFKGLGNIIRDVFTGNFKQIKEDATEAFNGIKDAFVKGFSFKDNFATGKKVGEEFASGLGSTRKKAKEEATKIASDVNEVLGSSLADLNKILDTITKRAAEREKWLASELKTIEDDIKQDTLDTLSFVQEVLTEIDTIQEAQDEKTKKSAEERISIMQGYLGATANILTSIADLYEANTEDAEKAEKQTKALRIASATIETISGAISAYMSAVKTFGMPQGAIIGAIQAAAVTAAGMTNIAKIKNTNVSRNAAGNASVSASMPTPRVVTPVNQTAVITGQSNETLLNRMAEPTRVYILNSDIEAAGNASKVRVDEASF